MLVMASNPAKLTTVQSVMYRHVDGEPGPGRVLDVAPSTVRNQRPFHLDFSRDDINLQANKIAIGARWEGFAHASHEATYEVALGTSRGASDVVAFKPASQQHSHMFSPSNSSGWSLQDGTTYYTTVRATNQAGSVTASSDGVLIMSQADDFATQGRVFDGHAKGSDMDVQLSATELSANWWFPSQLLPFVSHYELSALHVSTGQGRNYSELIPLNSIGNLTMTTIAANLTAGETYLISVRPCHAHVCFSSVRSDGILVSSLPKPGKISATYTPASPQQVIPAIEVQWETFAQIGAHVAYYEWSIGTSQWAGSELLFPWQRVDTKTLKVRELSRHYPSRLMHQVQCTYRSCEHSHKLH